MKRTFSFTVAKSGTNPRVVSLPARAKRIYWVRLDLDLDSDGDPDYQYLKQFQGNDVLDVPTQRPVAYWLEGRTRMWLDSTPDVDYSCVMYAAAYTDFPTTTGSTYTHWLMDNADDVLLAQTMILMAPLAQQPTLVQYWRPLRDEALKTLINAETEYTNANRDEFMDPDYV